MDKTDIKILKLLQNNGKLSNHELADRIALSPSPCLRRVKLLEDDGLIEKYVAILDPVKLGLHLNVLVSVGLESHDPKLMTNFETKIKSFSEITQCYLVAGQQHDYMLKVIVPTLDDYQHFLLKKLTQIAGVKNVHSSFILKKVVDHTTIPLHHLG